MIDADDSPELVLLVLGAALRGLSVLPELVVRTMSQHTPDETDVSHWLNTDEMKWLVAMAAGSTVADLAESIGYSERAMFRRLKDLYQRLGVANRTEALLWAGRHGLLVSK
jgi:DNA-binding NarL/FixJ family response regulator